MRYKLLCELRSWVFDFVERKIRNHLVTDGGPESIAKHLANKDDLTGRRYKWPPPYTTDWKGTAHDYATDVFMTAHSLVLQNNIEDYMYGMTCNCSDCLHRMGHPGRHWGDYDFDSDKMKAMLCENWQEIDRRLQGQALKMGMPASGVCPCKRNEESSSGCGH